MKRPAVEPSAGAPVTFPGTQSNPTQQQGSGQSALAVQKQPFAPISYGAGSPPPTVKQAAMAPRAGDPVTLPPGSKPVPDATHQTREMAGPPVYYHPQNSSATTVKKPAVEPRAGDPVMFSNKPVSDPKLHAGSSLDQPPKSRDFIGGGSTHQGGVAGHDGKLPIVGEAKLPTADEHREQPKGPAWPKGDLGVPTVGLDTFSRDAKIGKLRDPASPLADGTGFKGEKDLSGALSGANRPGIDDLGNMGGRKTLGETFDSVNRTPHNGDGKNSSSKTDQQSGETNEYGGVTHYATVGNTVAIVKDDPAGVTRETRVINQGTERERITTYDPSGRQSGAAVTRDGNGKIIFDNTITHFKSGSFNIAITTEDTRKTVHESGNKTPTPDAVDDSHAPAAVRELAGSRKTVVEVGKERKRQVSLPGEGRTQDRVQVDKKELVAAMVGKRTGDNSTPVPTDASMSAGTSGDKAPRKKLKPGDSVDNLTGGSTGVGGTPGRRPGGNEEATPSGDGSSNSSEGGSEPPRG